MAEGRDKQCWNHTSHVLALIANVNRDPKKSRAFKPADFNPYAKQKSCGGVPITKENIGILKSVFIKPGRGESG